MRREELIHKWLNHDLNQEELKEFKALEDYDDLTKLDKGLKSFRSPEYNSKDELDSVKQKIASKPSKPKRKLTQWLKVAAVFIIGLSIFYYTTTIDTTISTLAAQKTEIDLPDGSISKLNATSSLTYNKNNFESTRTLTLEGEAFFDVEKGNTFSVKTNNGIVSVLGTEFNVKNRNSIFEVICYEGSVKVTNAIKTLILKPGDRYLLIDGKYIATEKETLKQPTWLNNKSYFKSIPYQYVIEELERQFDVTVKLNNIKTQELFTGSFDHDDLDLALKEITLPFNHNYNITNRTISITSE